MTRRWSWIVAGGLAGFLGANQPAQACSCGPYIGPVGYGDPVPANLTFYAGNCVADIPWQSLRVFIDGVEATVHDSGHHLGDYYALLRFEPEASEGQTVSYDGCKTGECLWGEGEWVVGPADHTPPVATVGQVSVSEGETLSDGLNCPPYGRRLIISLEDFVFDDDVAMVRVEVVNDDVVVDGGLSLWDPGLAESYEEQDLPFTVSVFTDQSYTCVRTFAVDRAGNETPLGPDDCTATSIATTGREEQQQDDAGGGGCACAASSEHAPGTMLAVLVLLGLGRRQTRLAR